MIEPDGLVIPGVKDNQKLVELIQTLGIEFHKGLKISKSELGGIGLYFDLNDLPSDDLVILRIPQASTWDYLTLLDILNVMRKRDELLEAEIKESKVLINALSLLQPTTESEIIMCYLVGFTILRGLPRDDYYEESPLRKFDVYMDLLTSTYVLEYSEGDTSEDPFVRKLAESGMIIKEEYNQFVETFNELGLFKLEDYLSFGEYYQATQVVRSRTLEIPHGATEKGDDTFQTTQKTQEGTNSEETAETDADISSDTESASNEVKSTSNEAEKTSNQAESTSNEAEKTSNQAESTSNEADYFVNITLVPILDFANHSHDNNSYFDIDPLSKDIVLKLKTKDVGPTPTEITISYSPIESIQQFIQGYGFIPTLSNPKQHQLFELEVDLGNFITDFDTIRKWMQIVPKIQIIKTGDGDVFLNLYDIPLLFTPGLQYNKDWKDLVEEDEDSEELIALIKYQEEGDFDVIIGIETSIGINYDGELEHSDHLTAVAVKSIMSSLSSYTAVLSSEMPVTNEVITKYFTLQKELIQSLMQKYTPNDPSNLIFNQQHDYSSYMSPPKQLLIQ